MTSSVFFSSIKTLFLCSFVKASSWDLKHIPHRYLYLPISALKVPWCLQQLLLAPAAFFQVHACGHVSLFQQLPTPTKKPSTCQHLKARSYPTHNVEPSWGGQWWTADLTLTMQSEAQTCAHPSTPWTANGAYPRANIPTQSIIYCLHHFWKVALPL